MRNYTKMNLPSNFFLFGAGPEIFQSPIGAAFGMAVVPPGNLGAEVHAVRDCYFHIDPARGNDLNLVLEANQAALRTADGSSLIETHKRLVEIIKETRQEDWLKILSLLKEMEWPLTGGFFCTASPSQSPQIIKIENPSQFVRWQIQCFADCLELFYQFYCEASVAFSQGRLDEGNKLIRRAENISQRLKSFLWGLKYNSYRREGKPDDEQYRLRDVPFIKTNEEGLINWCYELLQRYNILLDYFQVSSIPILLCFIHAAEIVSHIQALKGDFYVAGNILFEAVKPCIYLSGMPAYQDPLHNKITSAVHLEDAGDLAVRGARLVFQAVWQSDFGSALGFSGSAIMAYRFAGDIYKFSGMATHTVHLLRLRKKMVEWFSGIKSAFVNLQNIDLYLHLGSEIADCLRNDVSFYSSRSADVTGNLQELLDSVLKVKNDPDQ